MRTNRVLLLPMLLAGLILVVGHQVGIEPDDRLLAARFAEQRSEALAELAARRGLAGVRLVPGAHAAFLSFGRRPISSRARAM